MSIDEAPGWAAIDTALVPLYGAQSPQHMSFGAPSSLSTNLAGCSAYASSCGPLPHWHYITYGLSQLFPEENDDADAEEDNDESRVSGWGFELTMRVAREDDHGDTAPRWPFAILNSLAQGVHRKGTPYLPGARIDFGAATAITGHPRIPDAPATAMTVLAVVEDPELRPRRETVNGWLTFCQVVGVTREEKEEMVSRGTEVVVEEKLKPGNPMLVTVPGRT